MKNYSQSLLQEEEISNLTQFQVRRMTSQMPGGYKTRETDEADEDTDEDALYIDEPADDENENALPTEYADLQHALPKNIDTKEYRYYSEIPL